MKKAYAFLSLILMCCGGNPYFDDKIIEKWSVIDAKIPSIYNSLLMFVPVENNKIGITNVGTLHFIYTHRYADDYSTFGTFLGEALNQRIVFDATLLQSRFVHVVNLSQPVKEEYEQHGVEGMANRFCEKHKQGFRIQAGSMNAEQRYSVLYYLFLHGYDINHDDYIGAYYATPTYE